MNLHEVAKRAAAHTGMTIADTERALRAGLETIGEAVMKGERVTVVNFGTFQTQDRDAYTGRNPANGEPVQVPASRKVAFKASEALRERSAA